MDELGIELGPLSIKEQEEIVCLLDDIACDSNLNIYIKQLTFKEKLVVFLCYEDGFSLSEIAVLLNVSLATIKYRNSCIEAKIKIVKGLIEHE